MSGVPDEVIEQREAWAEVEARQFDKTADAIEASAAGWRARDLHPDNTHMETVCLLKAATWREAARSLRQPKQIRLERDQNA